MPQYRSRTSTAGRNMAGLPYCVRLSRCEIDIGASNSPGGDEKADASLPLAREDFRLLVAVPPRCVASYRAAVFQPATRQGLDELPVEKQLLYNWQRNAAVLRRAV